MASKTDDAAAQHVIRTLRSLELLAEGPLTQAALARHLGVHRRTARRLLARLVNEGYAEEVENGQHVTFVATSRLAVVGRKAAAGLDLEAIGRRHLASLDGRCHGARFVAVLQPDGDGVWLPVVQAPPEAGASAWIEPAARTGPLHATAAGKIFLSSDTELLGHTLNQGLLAFTASTITSSADLLLELAAARARGYAVENGEHRPAAVAVASGVTSYLGEVVAALGAECRPGDDPDGLAEGVRSAALEFSREIGSAVEASLSADAD